MCNSGKGKLPGNLFLFLEPHIGWRHVEVTKRRTKQDFAQAMKDLMDVYFSDAPLIRVVLDNLNTHTPPSLYDTFEPEEARRIARRLEFHYTPTAVYTKIDPHDKMKACEHILTIYDCVFCAQSIRGSHGQRSSRCLKSHEPRSSDISS